MSWLPHNWRDPLSLLILLGVPLYIWQANPPGEFAGLLGAGWMLVVQFYFRKKEDQQLP